MNSISNPIPTQFRHLVPQASVATQPYTRPKREAPADAGSSAGLRSEGDREVAVNYSAALLGVANQQRDVKVYPMPAHSTFGQWWEQLHNAFEATEVVHWIRDRGINTQSIKLNPESGQLSFTLGRHLDPKQILHTVGLEDTHWAAISGSILKAGRVIAAGNADTVFTPPVSSFEAPVPYEIVGLFYKERQNLTEPAMRARAQEIGGNPVFTQLDPITDSSLITSRSEDALQNQKTFLGDGYNRQVAVEALKNLASTVENGIEYDGQIEKELKKTIHLSAYSTYRPINVGKPNTASVLQFLQDHGWDIPGNHAELVNLAAALSTPTPMAPVNGNLGGALSWPLPLERASQEQLRSDVLSGKVGDIELRPFTSTLEYLLNNRPISAEEQRNPRLLIGHLINSPRGKALGNAIQATFEARSVKGTANDWLLAALNVGSKNGASGVSLMVGFLDGWLRGPAKVESKSDASDAGIIAGYRPVSEKNTDKTVSAIIKELAEHLVSAGIASSPEIAAVQSHLMLASQAPEFLVKDIPDQVAVGTHSWVSFSTAVARIEAKAPGATAQMSYAQVMLQASIAPITDEERQVEFAAQNDAIKAWAFANGMNTLTDVAINQARKAYSAQISELSKAAETHIGEMPTTELIAREQLTKAFPDMDPALFDKKNITLQPSNRHFPGPYSILDLYIDDRPAQSALKSADNWGEPGRAFVKVFTLGQVTIAPEGKPAAWVSSSSAINVNDVLAKLKDLPRPRTLFKPEFANFSSAVKTSTSAHIKYLISKLPLQDRQNLEFGKITVREGVFYPKTNQPKRISEGALLVETERNGKVVIYEIDRLKGTVSKLADKAHFKVNGTLHFTENTTLFYRKITPPGEYSAALTDENRGAQGAFNSFSSARTQYLVDTVLADMKLPEIEKSANGVTTFDTEVPTYKVLKQVLLNLIPFRSAIQNFKSGDIAGGIFDLAFDIFGFAVGVGSAAKALKIAATAASALSKVLKVGKVIGRAALGALNPLDGIDDLGRGLLNLGRKTINTSYQGVKYLRGSYRNVNLLELAKKPDIAEGSYKTANRTSHSKTLAEWDNTTQHWYAYDPLTQQAYGKPLENFAADLPTPNGPDNLPAILKHHSPVQASGVKAIGGSPPRALGNATGFETYHVQLRQNIVNARTGGHAHHYNRGYKSGKLQDIPGYRSGMETNELIALASAPNRTPEQVGILEKAIKESLIEDAKYASRLLFNDVNAPGVKVTPVSQMHFLAHVDMVSKGECAALSNLMALGMQQNKQDLLTQNLYRALINVNEPKSAAYIKTLRDLQDALGNKFAFHMDRPFTRKNDLEIIEDLTNSPTSKTLRIGTKDHGVIAGIIVEPGNTKWFFYDPNSGLAEFTTLQSMQEGMEKVLNSGGIGKSLHPYGSKRGVREFNVSEFEQTDLSPASKAAMQRLLDTAL